VAFTFALPKPTSMQQTTLIKTPATDLLDILKERIEQNYYYQIRYENGYTILSFYNKESLLISQLVASDTSTLTASN